MAKDHPESGATLGRDTAMSAPSNDHVGAELELRNGEKWEFQSNPGEYYEPRDTGFHVELLRARFLWLVCQIRPEIAKELNGKLYDCFLRTQMRARVPDPTGPLLPEMRATLEEWQKNWGLFDEWIADMAALALFARAVEELSGGEPYPVEQAWSARGLTEPPPLPLSPFRFEHALWHPAVQRRAEAEKQIRAAFEKHLQEYLDGTERIAQSAGLKRASDAEYAKEYQRFAEGDDIYDRDLRWLIRSQLGDEKQHDIGDEFGMPENYVSRRIGKAKSMLGLSESSRPERS